MPQVLVIGGQFNGRLVPFQRGTSPWDPICFPVLPSMSGYTVHEDNLLNSEISTMYYRLIRVELGERTQYYYVPADVVSNSDLPIWRVTGVMKYILKHLHDVAETDAYVRKVSSRP